MDEYSSSIDIYPDVSDTIDIYQELDDVRVAPSSTIDILYEGYSTLSDTIDIYQTE